MQTFVMLLLIVGLGIFGLFIPNPYIFAVLLVAIALVEYGQRQEETKQRHKQTMQAFKVLIQKIDKD